MILKNTQRKAQSLEQKLLSEERLLWLIDSAIDVVTIVDNNGKITFINKAIEQTLGYLQNEVIGDNIINYIHPDDKSALMKGFEMIYKEIEDNAIVDCRCKHKDGSWKYLETVARYMTNEEGNKDFVVISRDISVRKESEKALRASEEKYRTLFENVLDGVYQATPEGKIITANPAMVKMLGYNSLKEFLSINVASALYLNPSDREDWAKELEERGELHNVEITFKRKDGSHIVVLDNSRSVYDKQGKLLYYEGTITDISELKKANLALKQNKANLKSLIENTEDSIWSVNKNYEIIIANSTFRKTFQSVHGVILKKGSKILEVLNPESRKRWKDYYDRALKGEHFSIEEEYKRSNLTKNVEIHFNPILSDKRVINGVSVFAHDITNRKQAALALQASEERYRLLVENAPIGIMSIDTQGNIQDVNAKVLEILGSPSSDSTKQINALTFPPLVKGGIADDIRKCIDSRKMVINECPYTSKWGKDTYLHYCFTPIHDKQGKLIRLQAIIEDISERKKATDQLFESYKYLGVINRKLGILLNVGRQQSKKDAQELLEFIINSAQELSNAKEVLIFKHNQSLNKLSLIISTNDKKYKSEFLSEGLNIGKCEVMQKLVIEQARVQKREVCEQLHRIMGNDEITLLLGLPLVFDGFTHGVLFLGFKTDKELTSQELDFYEVFAMQATNVLTKFRII